MSKVSFYNSVYDTQSKKHVEFSYYLECVKNGEWEDRILKYRANPDKESKEAKKIKSLIPAITVSGFFEDKRTIATLTKHSGYINIDIDAKDNSEVDLLDLRAEIALDRYVYALHVSVSGYGLTCYVKINPSKHLESFLGLEKYFANTYNVIIDSQTKDVCRLRFVSYDPELYINKASEKWIQYINKKEVAPPRFNTIFTDSDIDYILQQIRQRGIDITSNYYDWLKIGFAIASEYGQSGRDYFHAISCNNLGYNQKNCDKKYDNILKSNRDETSIGTFFWLCKQSGIDIKTEKTKKIETLTKNRRKTIGRSGGAKDEASAKESTVRYLKEFENIEESESNEVIEKVFALPEAELNADDSKNKKLEDVIEYVQTLDLKYNKITKKTEFESKKIEDIIYNSIFLDVKCIFPRHRISKEIVKAIMESNRIKSYDPFMLFFNKNKHLKPNGVFNELMDCINVPINSYADHIPYFIKKWMLSIIASMHGTYSLLILVLVGEQKTGKTNFFRYLLPDELKNYYAESKLDAGKDDEMLMSEKLIIVDDEFGGKSKKEASKLKDLASKQVFTLRKSYGHYNEDYNRIAVLGGTSNDLEILNDMTGNRRIIPVHIDHINVEKIKQINKTELFIELYNEWKKIGDDWMLSGDDIKTLNNNTINFVETTLEEDCINKMFKPTNDRDFVENFMSTTEMLSFAENRIGGKQRLNLKKFGQVLKKLGYKKVNHKKMKGFWVKKMDNFNNYVSHQQ